MGLMREKAAAIMSRKQIAELCRTRESQEIRVLLLMSPEYRNYGDVAIIEGALDWFRRVGLLPFVVEISNTVCMRWPEMIAKYANEKDILAFTGGGYMGSLWPDSQSAVERLLNMCPQNPVLILPQTIFFDNRCVDEVVFENCIINRRSYLILAREKATESYLKSVWKNVDDNRIAVMPDSAFLIKNLFWSGKRLGAGLCLRDDLESIAAIPPSQYDSILSKFGYSVKQISTVGDLRIPLPTAIRSRCFSRKIDPFRKMELVVTDRLHAMVLATLSGTPVVALDNVSGKVRGIYEAWLSGLPHVAFVDASTNIELAIKIVTESKMEDRERGLKLLAQDVEGKFEKLEKWLRFQMGDGYAAN